MFRKKQWWNNVFGKTIVYIYLYVHTYMLWFHQQEHRPIFRIFLCTKFPWFLQLVDIHQSMDPSWQVCTDAEWPAQKAAEYLHRGEFCFLCFFSAFFCYEGVVFQCKDPPNQSPKLLELLSFNTKSCLIMLNLVNFTIRTHIERLLSKGPNGFVLWKSRLVIFWVIPGSSKN